MRTVASIARGSSALSAGDGTPVLRSPAEACTTLLTMRRCRGNDSVSGAGNEPRPNGLPVTIIPVKLYRVAGKIYVRG